MYRFETKVSGADSYKVHQMVKKLFPDGREQFRIDGNHVIAKTVTLPKNNCEGKLQITEDCISIGSIRKFQIRGVAAKRDSKTQKMIPLIESTDASNWIHERSDINGFKITKMSVIMEGPVFIQKKGYTMTFNSVNYEGELKVTDTKLFEKLLKTGLGKGKSFGFGMMDIYE
jgi:CRISPR-associated protein Cas6/Cse3/CasE subtype I-E